MCDHCPSIIRIDIGKAHRESETVLMPVRVQEHCTVCDEREWANIMVAVPCDMIRKKDAVEVRKFVYSKIKDLMFGYGPISFQKLTEAIMEGLARIDLKRLAGEPFLIDMEPKGRA